MIAILLSELPWQEVNHADDMLISYGKVFDVPFDEYMIGICFFLFHSGKPDGIFNSIILQEISKMDRWIDRKKRFTKWKNRQLMSDREGWGRSCLRTANDCPPISLVCFEISQRPVVCLSPLSVDLDILYPLIGINPKITINRKDGRERNIVWERLCNPRHH